MILNQVVFEFYMRTSQRTMLSSASFHALALQPKWIRLKFVSHEANDIRLRPSHALLNGLEGSPICPGHLNDGRNITFWKAWKTLREFYLHGDSPWLNDGSLIPPDV